MKILRHLSLRSCMNCGAALENRNLICIECLNALVERFDSGPGQKIRGIQVNSLLNWNPCQSDLLSHLILSLKTEQENTWKELAKKFLLCRGAELNIEGLQRSTVLISLSSELGKNHAQMWGRSLSYFTGIPHQAGLFKTSEKKEMSMQRFRSKSERQSIELKSIVDLSFIQNKRVVFVDDIVTTGSTLHAAYLALGRPSEFECWSFCYRNPVLIAKIEVK